MKSNIGLVLEGGGAKGSYHLGAYKALMELGYKFKAVAGTSIGALNGAIIAQGDWKKAYDFWYYISNSKVYGVDEEVFDSLLKGDFKRENLEYVAETISGLIKKKGIDTTSMKNLYKDILNENKLRRSKVDLGIITVKLPEFETKELFKEDIEKGELLTYLMASANFPLFKREETKDGVFIDGGISNNLPLNMLPKKGITELVAIRTFGVGITKDFKDLDVDVTFIEPSASLGGTLDFNRNQARKNLILGYQDVYRSLKGYKGKDYCIKPHFSDTAYIENILTTGKTQIESAAEAMGYKNVNPTRFMMEKLFPRLADYLDYGIDVSYEDIILGFFEEISKTLTIEKDKIYTPEEFIQAIREEYKKEHKSKGDKKLGSIFTRSTFLSFLFKDEFFKLIMDIFF